jgi:hypothetical protein
MLNLYVPSPLLFHAYPFYSHAPCYSTLVPTELRREDHFGPSLMVVTQILRDLRPHHSWSPYCPPNFPKSNAASIRVHIPSDLRSVGKWMGVVTRDGRPGYADLGPIDKIEKRKWEMHYFWAYFEVENLDSQSLSTDIFPSSTIPTFLLLELLGNSIAFPGYPERSLSSVST